MPAAASSRGASLQHAPVATGQATGYSKLAAAQPEKPATPDWLWSENRKLLPTVFQEIQALCGRNFTLDAAANDSGDNAVCTNFCSPSNSFMSKEHTGHIWINAPFTQLLSFVQHYLHCKQLSPDAASACILVPGYLMPALKSLLTGMTCLKRYSKGAALFEHSARSSLNWPVYVFTDVPSGADQALSHGQYMHRLHNATVLSAAHDSYSESNERLAMLFEGTFNGSRPYGGLTAPILLDTGASSNFVSPRLLQRLGITYSPTTATLRLADDSSSPILGRVRLRFRLQSLTCTVTCYVTDLCSDFDLILGNSFMVSHKAVLDYSNFTASFRNHSKLCTLTPKSILTDKGKLPSQQPESSIRRSSKSLPPKGKATRRANRADQHVKYSDCFEDLDPELVLSCAQARKSIKQGCRSFLVLVTAADVARATLATASVTSFGAPTTPVADAEQAGLLRHVDALQHQYSDVFQEASGPPPDRGGGTCHSSSA